MIKNNIKVAVDAGPLSGGHSVRGVGVYVRELLKALGIQGVDIKSADLRKYDVVHFTSFKPFKISLPFSKPQGTKFILTIYDLIPLIYPKNYPPGIKGKINWLINKILIRKSIDAIITISETSKKDICRLLEIEPNRVFVTYLAAPKIFNSLELRSSNIDIETKYDLPKRFVLYVGDVNYNKNIPNLVKACKIAGMALVIAGKQAAETQGMDLNHPELRHLKNVDWSGVLRLGYVDDADLVKIYKVASVYVQPSFYEGFGLPLLEANLCKTPLVTSRNQCHIEILGTDFDFVDPKSPEDIARGIKNPNTGKKLPRTYTWDNTAKETQEIYEKI